ncbi:fibronectin type III domain-containing protein [Candidatus Dojkabacteria bacterium]|uniref:Fibronectin type III domain-containing protein n=1 Tax=Candidatus Dojkabacteria bacterium TaxID=2099670 RepID=A0A955L8D4_9BACT|nr:fibronectin type III domain-containing protein [Candidatus Dojkabacteria bacterium]
MIRTSIHSAKQIILWCMFILLFIAIGVLTIIFTGDDELVVQRIALTNISGQSTTVVWTTDMPTIGSVVVDGVEYFDDRDLVEIALNEFEYDIEEAKPRQTHHVTIRELEPETTYSFQVHNDSEVFEDQPFAEFTTAKIPDQIRTPDPVYGMVSSEVEETGISDGIIIFNKRSEAEGSSHFVSVPVKNGSYSLDAQNLLSADLSEYYSVRDNEYEVIRFLATANGEILDESIQVPPDSDQPVDTVVLSIPDEQIAQVLIAEVEAQDVCSEVCDSNGENCNFLTIGESLWCSACAANCGGLLSACEEQGYGEEYCISSSTNSGTSDIESDPTNPYGKDCNEDEFGKDIDNLPGGSACCIGGNYECASGICEGTGITGTIGRCTAPADTTSNSSGSNFDTTTTATAVPGSGGVLKNPDGESCNPNEAPWTTPNKNPGESCCGGGFIECGFEQCSTLDNKQGICLGKEAVETQEGVEHISFIESQVEQEEESEDASDGEEDEGESEEGGASVGVDDSQEEFDCSPVRINVTISGTGIAYEVKGLNQGESIAMDKVEEGTTYTCNFKCFLKADGGFSTYISNNSGSQSDSTSCTAIEDSTSSIISGNTVFAQGTLLDSTLYDPGVYELVGDAITTKNVTVTEAGPFRFFSDTNLDGIKQPGEEYIEDLSSIEFSVNKTADVQSYRFVSGWNVISVPMIMNTEGTSSISTASDLIEELNNQGRRATHVTTYRNGKFVLLSQRTDEQGNPITFGEDFAIVPGEGYFIRNYDAGNVAFIGNKVSGGLEVGIEQGWNLLGIYHENKNSFRGFDILRNMNEQGIDVDVLSKWDSGVYKNLVLANSIEYGSPYDVFPNSGYWIRSNSPGVQEFTPE